MNEQVINLSARCPIRTTLEMLGGKWRLLILFQLSKSPLRLSELKRNIPDVSEKMLIQELKSLMENGLVTRTNHGEVPPRVDYAITEKGLLALPLIEAMYRFASAYTGG